MSYLSMLEKWKKIILYLGPDPDESENLNRLALAQNLVQVRHNFVRDPGDRQTERVSHSHLCNFVGVGSDET